MASQMDKPKSPEHLNAGPAVSAARPSFGKRPLGG
jgi:hypothetical protein